MNETTPPPEAIAVIGMSGRFPGAENPDEFWRNLISGKDSISRFGDLTGENGDRQVGARGILDRPEQFDASFFGIHPKEAELMDPQHRIFLECAWEALEDGGVDPDRFPGLIGVFAGLSLNTYLLNNLGDTSSLAENYQVGEYQKMLGNDKDFLPVRVSYKLNLRGPSMAIQTACSTSLVAICQAATALLSYQTDLALAGGVSISFPQQRRYRFTEDGMVSPDGTCRAFDAEAAGTVFGHGCGVVLLKRLSEAIADKDPVLAVVKGWAVNNDGSDKIGFAAPGLNAQADVIAMAQAAAGVDPSEISYIEAHGTGTPLGDPVEIAALTKAFRENGCATSGTCAIGTGKTHIGHLDVAAGVTGLIKTIQQFRHDKIPALLHFRSPNPRIDFASSPFSPVSSTREWPKTGQPRIAGVSAFGVGGTNAHLIVSEPPGLPASTPSSRPQLLLLSAKSENSLRMHAEKLAGCLDRESPDLADSAYTLATRRHFPVRKAIVARDRPDAIQALGSLTTAFTVVPPTARKIAFLFPGQGAQFAAMTRSIYDAEPVFRAAIDRCAGLLAGRIHHDIRNVLYPLPHEEKQASERLHQTWITQPCLFSVEYALTRLLASWGVRPDILIGHSVGEFTAAVVAGTLTLEDALGLVAVRGKLMQNLPPGSMLAIRADAETLDLPEGVELSAINSPRLCTVSGPGENITRFQQTLEEKGVGCKRLPTSHAFHSSAMDPVLDAFAGEIGNTPLQAPAISWISTLTGKAVTPDTVTDSSYWTTQLRQPVRFSEALSTALREDGIILLEIGPGAALSQFARQHPSFGESIAIATLPSKTDDACDLYSAVAGLWQQGVPVDWKGFYGHEHRSRLHLPTYAFDRSPYWIDNSRATDTSSSPASPEPAPMPPTDLSDQLRSLVRELSGLHVTDDHATFSELGFDSLFLTQASHAIQSRFGEKITFRQLLGELSSISAVSAHLAAKIKPAPSSPVTNTAAPAPSSGIEAALQQQLRLIQNLIDKERATPSASGSRSAIRRPAAARSESVSSTRFGPYKPVEAGENGNLTPTQQHALSAWTGRYVGKTPGSKSYTAEHRNHYADPRAVAGFRSAWKEMVYPIVCTRSKGSRIWDVDGNEYIDITMGFGTYFFGHSPDWLIPAIEEQLKSGIEIGPQSPIAGKLAKEISALTRMDRVTFCNTGSEAVMAAMRLARTVTGRDRIVYFTGDYHGMFEEVLVRGTWVDGVYQSQPVAPGIPASLAENIVVLDYGDPASLEILRQHGHEFAAVMIEPVQSRKPDLQPRDFMREVRDITRRHGTALIFDEVVTGFRCHPGGAQAHFGVEADLATYGKVVGGGMPIGVLAGKKEYMDALDGGSWNYGDDSIPETGVTFFAGTFVRHPLALAAAWRVILHLKEEGPRLQIWMEERVSRFCRTLNDHFASVGAPIRLPHFSAHATIEHPADLKHASLLWYLLREKGIHIWEGRPLYFTTAHTDEDFDTLVHAFVSAVSEMQAAGFLPSSGEEVPSVPAGFPRFDEAPATEAQLEIFRAVQMGPEANCAFNESNIIRFDGTFDASAFRNALGDMVARHPALRSTFSEDGTRQFFHPAPRAVDLMEHDFSTHGGPESPSVMLPLTLLRQAESSTPFDLTRGPLVRFHLVRITPDRHEFLFTAHHIICDGWSFGMIAAELCEAYNSRKSGHLPLLPPAMSFADYARSEAAAAGSPERRAAESYWVAKHEELPPVLELPTDHPRPEVKSFRGAMESITIEGPRYDAIKHAAPRLGGTMFGMLLSSFATLLHRLTQQEDLVIGVPAAGQTRIGKDELVGHCLNFLPLRLRPAGDRSFAEFSAAVQEQVLEAYDHQDHTFGTLLQKIKVARDPGRVPLVSVIFNVDKTGIDQLEFDGLDTSVSTNPKQFVNFDLFFNLVQTRDKLIVECEYNTSLHDPHTIRTWLASYGELIASAIRQPSAPLGGLSLVSPSDRRKLLVDWNDTSAPKSGAPSIHRMFEEQADKTPDAIALKAPGKSYTYRELDRHANALATFLRNHGAGRETLVGICSERSPEMLVAILAILKAGAAYVPLDPAYPPARIRDILTDSRAPLLLTTGDLSPSLSGDHNSRILSIDDCLRFSADRPDVECRPSDLAYVIYTSGSTGKPKGVAIEHRNTTAFIDWAKTVFSPAELSGVLFSTSICFDLSVFEMFVTLSSGGTVILAKNALDLDEHPHRSEVTLINTVPSAISELLDAGLIPGSVQVINLAGEALATPLVDRIHRETPVAKVYDLYGPSEDTTYSTFTLRKPGAPATIGRPISNTRAYILDSAGNLVPPGVPGELCLGGDGLARGYLHQPELTARKFIPDPFSDRPGDRLYRTGDLARFQDDGNLQFLGRIDHQVKVRGFRIELGEIESALEDHPLVDKAVGTVVDGRIVAYVKPKSSAGGDRTDLWNQQWDLLYSSAISQGGTGNLDRVDEVIAGWSGAGNLNAQVSEWIESTVGRIRGYDGSRIFEIGCGTGQILSRLSPDAGAYWAADISGVAIDALENTRPSAQVKLLHRPADDFSGIPLSYFDTVVINSVAQYFPDADYLAKVIRDAAAAVRTGGRIFLGDIQSHALLETHHTEALASRAQATAATGELKAKITQRLANESELSVDPDWFLHLQRDVPAISHLEFQLRRGTVSNETNVYHYDVILHVGHAPELVPLPEPRPWGNLNLEQLEAILTEEPRPWHFNAIPDARLLPAIELRRALASQTADAPVPARPSAPSNAVSAEDLFALAENLGLTAHVRWTGDGTTGHLEAALIPAAVKGLPDWAPAAPVKPVTGCANEPASSAITNEAGLPKELRDHIGSRLPGYMIPSEFVFLSSFPLTPNGKVDRRKLPPPSSSREPLHPAGATPPRNETERKLAAIWEQVLGKSGIGVHDDIFDLGGDSILIFQITTRANQAGMRITPAQVFRHRTVAGIAAEKEPAAPSTPVIQRVDRDAYRRKN